MLPAMSFIPPMLTTRLTDQRLLSDPRYIAEPKLDGQRAQVQAAGGRTVAAYSRTGRELLARHRGLRWLRDVRWPVEQAVIDGELYSGDGAEGIDAILTARQQTGGNVTFAAFDVLLIGDREVMAEPWTDRRKRLEDLFPDGVTDARVQLVPTFEDAARLWRVWVVEWGGEDIVLKDRRSGYRPGTRSRARWKAKHKLVLAVEVLHFGSELVRWGDWGQACVMAFAHRDPLSGEQVTVEQAVWVPGAEDWIPHLGRAEVLC
jgi:ATP-dependent DNA ligase